MFFFLQRMTLVQLWIESEFSRNCKISGFMVDFVFRQTAHEKLVKTLDKKSVWNTKKFPFQKSQFCGRFVHLDNLNWAFQPIESKRNYNFDPHREEKIKLSRHISSKQLVQLNCSKNLATHRLFWLLISCAVWMSSINQIRSLKMKNTPPHQLDKCRL